MKKLLRILLVLVVVPIALLSSCVSPYKSLSADQHTAASRVQGQNDWVSDQMNAYKYQHEQFLREQNSYWYLNISGPQIVTGVTPEGNLVRGSLPGF